MPDTPTPRLAPLETPKLIRQRDIAALRDMLGVVCRVVWGERVPGKHLWSIPVDEDRDFDVMFSDAFDELEQLRAARATAYAEGRREALEEVIRQAELRASVVQTYSPDAAIALRAFQKPIEALRDTPAPPSREEAKICANGHMSRRVGCVSCVLLFPEEP